MPDSHVVCIIGGACAGSTAAEMLAEAGIECVVFEQNPKPYGKVEDGLPRWHNIQRKKEYGRIDARLDRPGVHYVPLTKIDQEIPFDALLEDWGFTAVIFANGAWKDRPVEVEGIDEFINKGLVYQNPFVYWFNHMNEAAFEGPMYDVPDSTAILGGGLSSIDCAKACQLILYEKALKDMGVECDMFSLEHKGITKFCEEKGINPETLGVKGIDLYYRRRKYDMPLAEQKDRSEEAKAKVEATRAKILQLAMEKFRFSYHQQNLSREMIVEDDRLVGLVMCKTRVEGRKAFPLEGTEFEVRHPFFISSIGSVPEPMDGVEMTGAFYKFEDWDLGIYGPRENVFGVGNAVTGQGNIVISIKHSRDVCKHLIEEWKDREKLPEKKVEEILERVKLRQEEVGYDGDYKAWIEKVIPSDLE